MGKRKVSILEPATTTLAEIALFMEAKGMPQTAKKFIDDAFIFFEKLSDERIEHRPCTHRRWKKLNYRCISYKKKYLVVYLSHEKEVVICDFVPVKLLS